MRRQPVYDSLERYEAVRKWERLFEQTLDLEPVEVNFLETLGRYRDDLRFRLGSMNPYQDDRLANLKDISRGFGPMYDAFAAKAADTGHVSGGAQSTLDFMNRAAMDLAGAIHTIEQLHPELLDWFRAERAEYARQLNSLKLCRHVYASALEWQTPALGDVCRFPWSSDIPLTAYR